MRGRRDDDTAATETPPPFPERRGALLLLLLAEARCGVIVLEVRARARALWSRATPRHSLPRLLLQSIGG